VRTKRKKWDPSEYVCAVLNKRTWHNLVKISHYSANLKNLLVPDVAFVTTKFVPTVVTWPVKLLQFAGTRAGENCNV
jgi:hypothetical protein